MNINTYNICNKCKINVQNNFYDTYYNVYYSFKNVLI